MFNYWIAFSILIFFAMATIAAALWNLQQTFVEFFRRKRPRVVMLDDYLLRTDLIVYVTRIQEISDRQLHPVDGIYTHTFAVCYMGDAYHNLTFETYAKAVLCRNVLLKDLCNMGNLMFTPEQLNKTMEGIKDEKEL